MKNKIIIIISLTIIIFSLLGVVLYNEIPRLKYKYDEVLDGYVVAKAYGHVDTYTIDATYNNKDVVGINREAFANNDLKYLDLTDTNIRYIATGAFLSCSNLKKVIFPTSLEEIANNAFMDCQKLSNVDLSMTNLEILGGSVFFDCINLTKVKLPKSLREVGSYCFYNTNIIELECYETTSFLNNALLGVDEQNIIYKDGDN